MLQTVSLLDFEIKSPGPQLRVPWPFSLVAVFVRGLVALCQVCVTMVWCAGVGYQWSRMASLRLRAADLGAVQTTAHCLFLFCHACVETLSETLSLFLSLSLSLSQTLSDSFRFSLTFSQTLSQTLSDSLRVSTLSDSLRLLGGVSAASRLSSRS